MHPVWLPSPRHLPGIRRDDGLGPLVLSIALAIVFMDAFWHRAVPIVPTLNTLTRACQPAEDGNLLPAEDRLPPSSDAQTNTRQATVRAVKNKPEHPPGYE
jgi:hypothetical protein